MELFGKTIDNKQFIDYLIYNEEIPETISALQKINDPKLLFMFVSEYN
jgi:hypothetical protein